MTRHASDPFTGMEAVDGIGAPTNDTAGAELEPTLVYGSAEEFLKAQLLPSYIRNINPKKARWCPRWFMHPEAIMRVQSMWREWEHLRLEAGTGSGNWWLNHADPHMRVLLDLDGPFFNCVDGHEAPKQFKIEDAPSGWFPDERLDRSI